MKTSAKFTEFLYSPLGFVLVIGGAIALLWKPLLSKLLAGDGLLASVAGALGAGGLLTKGAEGIGYVLEASEDGIEIAVEYLGQQIICGGDSGAAVVTQMEQAKITSTFQIETLQKKEAGTLTGLPKLFSHLVTWENFNHFWVTLQQEAAGDPKMTEIQIYANGEQMALFAYKQNGGYLG